MALFRSLSVCLRGFIQSKHFAIDNGISFSTFKQPFVKPLLNTNLPCLVGACGKVSIAEELGLPEPPKKPLTPFLRYYQEKLKSQSGANVGAVTSLKDVKQEWSELEDSKKLKYSNDYKSEFTAYKQRYESYIEGLSEDQFYQMKQLKTKRIEAKLWKKKRLEFQKELELTKKPKAVGKNAFVLFSLSIKDDASVPKDFIEKVKYTAKKWRNLSESQKDVYRKKHKEEELKFKKELEVWENRMIKDGREDLVNFSRVRGRKLID